ncbi:hypothetical protein CYMTET_53900, partial [Cymbomonas tetramitiformis]
GLQEATERLKAERDMFDAQRKTLENQKVAFRTALSQWAPGLGAGIFLSRHLAKTYEDVKPELPKGHAKRISLPEKELENMQFSFGDPTVERAPVGSVSPNTKKKLARHLSMEPDVAIHAEKKVYNAVFTEILSPRKQASGAIPEEESKEALCVELEAPSVVSSSEPCSPPAKLNTTSREVGLDLSNERRSPGKPPLHKFSRRPQPSSPGKSTAAEAMVNTSVSTSCGPEDEVTHPKGGTGQAEAYTDCATSPEMPVQGDTPPGLQHRRARSMLPSDVGTGDDELPPQHRRTQSTMSDCGMQSGAEELLERTELEGAHRDYGVAGRAPRTRPEVHEMGVDPISPNSLHISPSSLQQEREVTREEIEQQAIEQRMRSASFIKKKVEISKGLQEATERLKAERDMFDAQRKTLENQKVAFRTALSQWAPGLGAGIFLSRHLAKTYEDVKPELPKGHAKRISLPEKELENMQFSFGDPTVERAPVGSVSPNTKKKLARHLSMEPDVAIHAEKKVYNAVFTEILSPRKQASGAIPEEE